MLDCRIMRSRNTSIALGAALCLVTAPLLGCPQIVFGIPAALRSEPRFQRSAPAQGAVEFAPLVFDLQSEGRYLAYRLRIDGQNLEPTTGGCRRWFLPRVAREAEVAQETFCKDDFIRLHLEAAVPHILELSVGSEQEVAERRLLRPGPNVQWFMSTTTPRFEMPIQLEAGYSYTLRTREVGMDFSEALGENAPEGKRWDLDKYEPIYSSGIRVGTLTVSLVRNVDGELVSERSIPIYSGPMKCQPPFCEAR